MKYAIVLGILTLVIVVICTFMWAYGTAHQMWYTDAFLITGHVVGWPGAMVVTLLVATDKSTL